MELIEQEELSKPNTVFYCCVCFTVFALVCRLAELLPMLGLIRINLISLIITGLLFLLSRQFTKRKCFAETETKLMLGIFILAMITIPFSVWPGQTFTFIFKGPVLVNIAVFLFSLSVITDTDRARSLLKIFILSNLAMILMLFINPVIAAEGRLTVTYSYDPNDLALLFACCFPLVFAGFLNSRLIGKIFSGAVLALIVLAILKTGSRGGILALGCAVILLLLSPSLKLGLIKKFLFGVFISVFLLTSHMDSIKERWQQVLQGTDYNFNQEIRTGGRLGIWRGGVNLLIDKHLLVGAGAGNTSAAMGEAYGKTRWKAMHNSFLQAFLELGILGFVFFLLLLRAFFRNCSVTIKTLKEEEADKELLNTVVCLKIGFIAFLIAGTFLSQFYSIVIPFFLAVSTGLRKLLVPAEEEVEDAELTYSSDTMYRDWHVNE